VSVTVAERQEKYELLVEHVKTHIERTAVFKAAERALAEAATEQAQAEFNARAALLAFLRIGFPSDGDWDERRNAPVQVGSYVVRLLHDKNRNVPARFEVLLPEGRPEVAVASEDYGSDA
jgi:hypothetical protein